MLEADAVFSKVMRRLALKGEAVSRDPSEDPETYRRRLLDQLSSIRTPDPEEQLELDVACAYLRYLLAEHESNQAKEDTVHTEVVDEELGFGVDEAILPLVKALWTHDYHTISSCESAEYGGGWAEVTFDRPADVQRMLAVCVAAADAWGDPEFFGRVSGDTVGGGKYRGTGVWEVKSRIASHSIFSSGVPGLHPLMVTVFLPPSDIDLAARAVKEFSGYTADRWASLDT